MYSVQVEKTIEVTVEVEAASPYEAEVAAEDRAIAGDYDDIFEEMAVDATYATFGAIEVEEVES